MGYRDSMESFGDKEMRCSRCPEMIEFGIMCLTCADVEAGRAVRRMRHGFRRVIREFQDIAEPPAVHFIGFRGEEYHSAVRVWGLPDFYHRGWDTRAQREIAEGDVLVFGPKADPEYVSPYTYDDSNEADDPAARERIQ
jgi:hypothetical protein